jgi:3,4-dihydroxy 2-butanone 4-phosphate synthase / GTP cyclohydrolase II
VDAPLACAEDVLEDLRRGGFVLVADHDGLDSYADVLVAAEHADADAINWLATEARGILYLALPETRCDELRWAPVQRPPETASWLLEGQHWKQAMRVMVDARHGISTGISAADRALTVALALDPESGPEAFVVPGHMQPIAARTGGVVAWPGRTEAFVDLPRVAGLRPGGVASSVMTEDGSVARLADVAPWCERHGIRATTVDSIHRLAARRTDWLDRTPVRALRTEAGSFRLTAFHDPIARVWHRAIVHGELPDGDSGAPVPVAVLGACTQGEALGQLGCPRHGAAEQALAALALAPAGVLLHVEDGAPCCHGAEADAAVEHAWLAAARMLEELGVRRIAPVPGHGKDLTPLTTPTTEGA